MKAVNKHYIAPSKVHSIQQTIPAERIFENGMFGFKGKQYSATWQLQDIDYASASDEAQEEIFLGYSEILNALDGKQGSYKLTLFNRNINRFKTDYVLLPEDVGDGFDHLRSEYNNMRRHNRAKANGMMQEKYLTVTTEKQTPELAEQFFDRFGVDFSRRLQKLKSGIRRITANERLALLHDFYRCGKESYFRYDAASASRRKSRFQDYICPDFLQFHHFDFDINQKFGRVLFMRDWGQSLHDNTLTRLMELKTNMMLSVDIIPMTPEEIKKFLDDAEMNVESNIDRWSQRPGAERRRYAILPSSMKMERQIVSDYIDDVKTRGQKVFLCNLTIVVLADTMDLLDEYTESLIETGYECGCQIQPLGFQQLPGLQTVLPYGPRFISNLRDATTESTAVLLPFSSLTINHKSGIPYGVHADTKQEMMIDRRLLVNGNEWIVGVSGSGKSMFAKIISIMEALLTNGDIIFLDPHGEFTVITQELGGQIVRLGSGSSDRINPLDPYDSDYTDAEQKPQNKTNLLVTLFRSILGVDFTKEMESIVDRCRRLVYSGYPQDPYALPPTLEDFFGVVCQQPEPAAARLKLLIEPYIMGSFNAFSGQTNVDLSARIICYDLSELDSTLWDGGMAVIMDSIWNRLYRNKQRQIPTYIKIDEVARFLTNPVLVNSFDSFYYEARKFGGYITGIIQNINKLMNNKTAQDMLANSEIVVMLRQDKMDADVLKSIYDLSRIQVDQLLRAEPGCGLFKSGNNFVGFDGRIEPGYIFDLADTKPKHNY